MSHSLNNSKRKPTDRISVVQLHSYDYGGGAEAVARLNHAGLKSLGHSSQLLVASKTGDDADIEKINYRRGFPGSRRLARKLENITGLQYTYSPSFRQVATQFEHAPDVVHLHGLHGAEGWADLVGVARLSRSFATVCSLHDLWLFSGHCVYPLECNRWTTGCGKCPDLSRYPSVRRDATRLNWMRKKRLFDKEKLHCIAPSEWVKRQMSKSPILASCPVSVVPNPVDTKVFKPGDRSKAKIQLGISPDKPTVMVAANDLDSLFKGAGDAVEVLNGLVGTGAVAILVGKGSDEMAKRISLPNKSVGYIECNEKMATCYRASDIFLMPSKVETFGMVSAEATACESVVVSYKAGGLEEVTRTARGIVVEDGRIPEMLEATRQLVNAPDERKVRSTEGRRNVNRLYSVNVHSSGCAEAYRRAIQDFDSRRSGDQSH